MNFLEPYKQNNRERKYFLFTAGLLTTIIIWLILLSQTLQRLDLTLKEKPLPTVTKEILSQSIDSGAQFTIVDLREPELFKEAHIEQAINIPLGSIWTAYRTGQIPKDQPVIVYSDDDYPSQIAVRELTRETIRLDNISYLSGGLAGWQQSEYPLSGTAHIQFTMITADDLKILIDEKKAIELIDVRTQGEYDASHIANSINVPFDQFDSLIGSADLTLPWIVIMSTDNRAAVYEKIQAMTKDDFQFLDGGITEWANQGFPIEQSKKKR